MNEFLRDRLHRKLDALSDERLYQVLDYVEFLESKYAERANPPANVFTKFAEGIEDRLRAGRVSATTIAETMNLMNKAVGVLSGVAAAGKSVATDIVEVASGVATGVTQGGSTPRPPASPPAPAIGAEPAPRSGETAPPPVSGGASAPHQNPTST
jgi:hypothetical protein